MPPTPQPLHRVLASDTLLSAWDARHRREAVLTDIIRGQLPRPLAARIRVTDATGDELILSADAGAVAGIVRQRTTSLLAVLHRNGWQFSGLRIRTQVRIDAPIPKKLHLNQPDKSSLQALAALTRTLPPGPLRAALTRLVRRVGA